MPARLLVVDITSLPATTTGVLEIGAAEQEGEGLLQGPTTAWHCDEINDILHMHMHCDFLLVLPARAVMRLGCQLSDTLLNMMSG